MTPLGWVVMPLLILGAALLVWELLRFLGIPGWVMWPVALMVLLAGREP